MSEYMKLVYSVARCLSVGQSVPCLTPCGLIDNLWIDACIFAE